MVGSGGGCDASQCQRCGGPVQGGEIVFHYISHNNTIPWIVNCNTTRVGNPGKATKSRLLNNQRISINKIKSVSEKNVTTINESVTAESKVWLYVQAYAETARSQWVKEWPGQVVLCTSQIYWTSEVHEAIRDGADVSFYILFLWGFYNLHC